MDGVVRWVASQSANPALEALMREAERERQTRPPSPAHDPGAWSWGVSAVQRRPLASSTSSADRGPARARSSSHSATPPSLEPEAMAFIELLKDVSRQLDHNSQKKQRQVARTTERSAHSTARPLTKTASASAICPATPSQRPLSSSTSAPRGRALAKTASWGASAVSGKSTQTSLPSLDLNRGPKLAPTPVRTPATLEPSSGDDDAMQGVIDLTESGAEWERPISSHYVRVDDDMHSDDAMDVSFVQSESLPKTHVPAPKPKQPPPRPNTASRLPTPTQRARTGPPPLGMRRAPQPPPSQYTSSQGSKSATVPRFKPPLLASAGGTNKKPAPTIGSKLPLRGGAAKVAVVERTTKPCKDADSSFDISFDVDADALEEAMKAYD